MVTLKRFPTQVAVEYPEIQWDSASRRSRNVTEAGSELKEARARAVRTAVRCAMIVY